MTTSCVLDVSSAAAILFREPDSQRVAPALLLIKRAVVPQIFHLELANVARTKVRRREIDWPQAEVLLRETAGWPVEVRTVAWEKAWALSMEHGLTVYDAAYLHLALEVRVPLMTLDSQLIAAAGHRSLL